MIKDIKDILWKDRLAKRLIATMILVSTCFSFFASGLQVYWRYSEDIRLLNANFDYIETGFIESIEKSLWLFSFPQLNTALDGLANQSDITYIGIKTSTGHAFIRGDSNKQQSLLKKPMN